VGDEEPSLGSFDRMTDQAKSYSHRGSVFGDDCEHDNADAEPSLSASEDHPTVSLGFADSRDRSGDQSFWGHGGQRDDREEDAGDNREHDDAESGIADEDGLREQLGEQFS